MLCHLLSPNLLLLYRLRLGVVLVVVERFLFGLHRLIFFLLIYFALLYYLIMYFLLFRRENTFFAQYPFIAAPNKSAKLTHIFRKFFFRICLRLYIFKTCYTHYLPVFKLKPNAAACALVYTYQLVVVVIHKID